MARPSPQTDRVVALVDLLTQHPDEPWTLAALTRRLRINKSTAHAILASLHGSGWLLRDPSRKTYRLGPALVAVGQAADTGTPALDFARPVMAELAWDVGAHCAALAVSDDALTVAHQATDARAQGAGLRVGSAFPLRAPFGSAAVAWADARVVTAWLAPLPGATRDRYRAALVATRRRGFAVELAATPADRVRDLLAELRDVPFPGTDGPPTRELLERLAGDLAQDDEYLATDIDPDGDLRVTAVNAPVHDHTGRVVLVVSLNGFAAPRRGADVERIGARLVAATSELSEALGAQAAQPDASERPIGRAIGEYPDPDSDPDTQTPEEHR